MTTKMATQEWPKIKVRYHGSRASEIITVEAAAKRYKLRADEIGWLQSGEIAGTSLNRHPSAADVYMIHRYTLDESIRDAAQDLLHALEGIMDLDLIPKNSVCGRMAMAAIEKAKREGK